jgi:DNA-binding NarL/FixJ family response regulator
VVAIRVVLAEDNYLLREGVRRLIELQDDIELVGVCGDLDELLASVDEQHPDVVLTDIRMPPTGTDEGIKAAGVLRTSAPSIGVVVLSQHADPAYALALLEGGAGGRAYLLKERVADVEQLLGAIRAVAGGGSVIDPQVVDAMIGSRSDRARSALARLTPRELEILSEMAQGKTNTAIGATLVISERAVEKHINSILAKLDLVDQPDVNRRVKAVLLFLAGGG